MLELSTIRLAWALLGLYLVVGLVLYERTRMRLGGILVLPLLLLYGLIDLSAVLVFAFATATAYALGTPLLGRFPLAGRKALYLYLTVGAAVTAVASRLLGNPLAGLLLALLPGLYAYNLHREGPPQRATAGFMAAFGALLGIVIVGVRVRAGAAFPDGWMVPLGEMAAAVIPLHIDASLALGAVVLASLQGTLDEKTEVG